MPQIAAAAVAAIAYVGSSAAAVVAGTATLAQIATVAAVGIGAGVGGIAAAKALTPKIESQGAAVRWEANPDAPLRFAFGRVGVKGNIVDAAIYGPDRMYVSFACTVSAAGPIKRFVNFRAGDYYMTFNGSGQATTEPYAGEMWLSTRLGAQPDTALSLPSGLKNGAAFPGWNSGRKLSGSACYMVTLGENSKRSAYEGKVPAFVTVIEGLYCYDPRLDSTYPGGSGSCRLNDPATWVWTRNPILFALKWALGLWEGPVGKGAPQVDYQVGGIGAKVESIVLPTVVEAANVADANGWTSAAWPSTDDDKAQVLDGFLKAGGARYAEIAGRIAFIHRAAPRAPVFTVRARDTAGPIEIDTTSSKLNRINTIRPRYWSEDQEWEMTALPEVTAIEWQEEDGQGVAVKRTRGADYTFVDQAKQARELASLEISNSREGIKGRVPLRPYMDPEPGNTFIFDEPDFALSELKCIVLEVEDDTENDTVVVTFETETDGKYPYAYGQTASPPPAQELDPYDPTYVTPPLPGDWTIVPRPPAPGGSQLPGFDLGGLVSNETADSVIVEHGPSSTGPWTQAYEGPPNVTSIPIDGLQPGATYYVAVRYRRGNNYSERYVYGPYVAPALIGDVMPDAPGLNQIKADIETAFGDILDVSGLIDQTRADLDAADQNLVNAITGVDDKANQLVQLTAELENRKASVASLDAQVARIDGVEAVNASQALALVDLENGKVALSEYNTLKGEVTAARDGAPSLLGQIQNLKSVDLALQGNKASVESVNALTARTANTEADIIDLELALATETGARAQAIQQVSASSRNRPNMLANGSGELGLRGISCIHIGWGGVVTPLALFAEDTSWGRIIRIGPFGGGTYILEWDDVTAAGSTPFTITGDAVVFGLAAQDRSYFDIQCLDSNGNLVPGGDGDQNPIYGSHDFSPDDANRNAYAVSFTTPAGTVRVRSRFIVEAQNSNPSYIAVRQVKTERGSLPASRYSADASQAVIEASVTEHSLALIDLETQQALARWEVVANASGGKPARIGLTSSSLGSFVALDAPFIFWGDNTVFDDATDTLQTTVGPNIRVLAFGAPFGASGNLLEWWGPSSIAIGSMTTANGLNGRMTTAPYVFDNVVVTVAARFAAATVTVFRTTSSTTAAQLTSTGTVLVEASVTSTSEDDVTAPIVTADVVGVSSGGVETVLATKSVGSGLPEDPLVYTFAPVQGSYPTYRVKVRGSGPVSKNGQSTVEVTLKTSPVA